MFSHRANTSLNPGEPVVCMEVAHLYDNLFSSKKEKKAKLL